MADDAIFLPSRGSCGAMTQKGCLMYRSLLLIVVLLVGCKFSRDRAVGTSHEDRVVEATPEGRASDTSLAYTSVPIWEPENSWPLVCPDDQLAKPLPLLKAELAVLEEGSPDLFTRDGATVARKLSVKQVKLEPEVSEGTIIIEVAAGETRSTLTVDVRRIGDKWCVVTGWAEDKRLGEIAKQAQSAVFDALGFANDWRFDEAKAKLAEADVILGGIPGEHSAGRLVRAALEAQRTLIGTLSENWLGGRWIGRQEKDPMTDTMSATARLESLDGIPNVIGNSEKVSLILRCRKGKFEAYVSTGTMLDTNWRNDSVSGQHRFGDAKAERFVGTVSSSRDSVFFRKPKKWAGVFKDRDGSKWLVELPVYNRTPHTVTFDLTASSKAVDMVLGACGG